MPRGFMVFFIGGLAVASVTIAQESSSNRQGWGASVGVGALFSPAFAGSGEGKVRGLPLLDISSPNNPFFLNTYKGLGASFTPAPRWGAGLALQYVPGRDEDDDRRIRGLGDIDDTAGIAAFANYALTPRMKLEGQIRQELGGSEGWTARLGASGAYPLDHKNRLIAGLDTTYGSNDYMQSWYGIDSVQASRSGLPSFDADAGFRDIAARVGVVHALNDRVSLNATAGYAVLVGDARKSPVSDKNGVPSLLLGASYRF